jgi:hypothetical protein
MFLWDLKPSAVSLKIPSDSAVWVPMMARIDVQSLSMQFMRAMGRYFAGFFWVVFVWFICELGGACASFFGGVTIFSHHCKEGEDYVVGFFGEELKDLIG